MKKNIGSQLALCPTPVTVIGARNGEKPTWTLVAYAGIIGHDRVLVSGAKEDKGVRLCQRGHRNLRRQDMTRL